jgi:hypothetical protein
MTVPTPARGRLHRVRRAANCWKASAFEPRRALPAPQHDRLLLEILSADERAAGDTKRERH